MITHHIALEGNSDPQRAGYPPFDGLSPDMILRAFGVDYGHVHPPEGGDLYVTRLGWPFLPFLLPANWYTGQRYAREGVRLEGTGQVYHLSIARAQGKSVDLVIKFSRVAQEVLLNVATTFPDDIPLETIANARFNSPMEEFGLVMELRRSTYGPRNVRILTQHPLAIYAPSEEFEQWELGRSDSRFRAHWHLLAQDQEGRLKAIELDIKRVYVVIYGWIEGEDAEQAWRAGHISHEDFTTLTPRVVEELRGKGFRVLDNKPRHFILRQRRSDEQIVRKRDGEIVYGLVDFELLQRTPEYQRHFRIAQRARYWQLQCGLAHTAPRPLPLHLRRTSVFGVEYVFGTTAAGGKLWVVGNDPELFDYFLPGRWRRTPRVKLSLTNEVYHTRTRDNVHVVYRRSRVGMSPHIDPVVGKGQRIREHGYNSPFEEVAIAERLRLAGIPTIYPRAIYRTGHESTEPSFHRDMRRFLSHVGLDSPEGPDNPILSPDYDYYTIWGYFRGLDPQQKSHGPPHAGVIDLEEAYAEALLDAREHDEIIENIHRRLETAGFDAARMGNEEFVVFLGADGSLDRSADGHLDVRFCVDALTAYEHELLSEEAYRSVVRHQEDRYRSLGYEDLHPGGHHLLLSMTPDGELAADNGEPAVVMCNFELVREI